MEPETPAVNDLPAKWECIAAAYDDRSYNAALRRCADELEAALARERDRNSNDVPHTERASNPKENDPDN